jgi:hypothetical protein
MFFAPFARIGSGKVQCITAGPFGSVTSANRLDTPMPCTAAR